MLYVVAFTVGAAMGMLTMALAAVAGRAEDQGRLEALRRELDQPCPVCNSRWRSEP